MWDIFKKMYPISKFFGKYFSCNKDDYLTPKFKKLRKTNNKKKSYMNSNVANVMKTSVVMVREVNLVNLNSNNDYIPERPAAFVRTRILSLT